jgi:hypothetical protein
MDPAPQVATMRHVAALALPPFPGVRPLFPFIIGVLQQLPIQGIAIRLELVTGVAELRPLKRGAADRAAMGDLRGRE